MIGVMTTVGVLLEVVEDDNEDVCHMWTEGVDQLKGTCRMLKLPVGGLVS